MQDADARADLIDNDYANLHEHQFVGVNIDFEDNPGVQGGAPVLRGTWMPVNAIVDNFDYGVSAGEIAEQFEVPPDCIEAIVSPSACVAPWPGMRYQQNLAGRRLALVVPGSNISSIVSHHGATIAARVKAATPGGYDFIEMPLPPRRRKNDN